MEQGGWIKIHRKLLEHPRASSPRWLALWVRLIGEATHKPIKAVFEGNKIDLLPGQLITGRNKLAVLVGCSPSEIEFLLKVMELGQQIRQQKKAHSRLISIENYNKYQTIDREIDNKKTADRQPIDTKQEVKKLRSKEVKNKDKYMDFVFLTKIEYAKLLTNYGKPQTTELIQRLNDYVGSKGDKYKSHYYTLLNFARRDNFKKITPTAKFTPAPPPPARPLTPENLVQATKFQAHLDKIGNAKKIKENKWK